MGVRVFSIFIRACSRSTARATTWSIVGDGAELGTALLKVVMSQNDKTKTTAPRCFFMLPPSTASLVKPDRSLHDGFRLAFVFQWISRRRKTHPLCVPKVSE